LCSYLHFRVYLVDFGLRGLFFFSSRRRHTRSKRDWSSDVCSSDLRSPLRTKANRLASSRLGANTSSPMLSQSGSCTKTLKDLSKIGRASCRERCRSRGSPEHDKQKEKKRTRE